MRPSEDWSLLSTSELGGMFPAPFVECPDSSLAVLLSYFLQAPL